jgi:hypothetical protein
MNGILKSLIHATLLTMALNIIALVLEKADAPIITRILVLMAHGHYFTLSYAAACTMNRQFILLLSGVTIIALSVLHQPSFHAINLLLPVAGGIALGLGVLAALQESQGTSPPSQGAS